MTKPESSVDRVYVCLREMAVNFEFKPEERLNESALSAKLGASRTPLREALNRLVAEGLLTFKNGRGFFCRSLSPARILELYEARAAIETEAVIRAIERASDAEIDAVATYLEDSEATYGACDDLPELLRMDEEFHTRLAELSNNAELLRMLANLNDRIRYVRLVNLQLLHANRGNLVDDRSTLSAHRVIMEAIQARDTGAAVTALRGHIERRREETTEAVRIAYSQLYVPVH
ncbi:GntR family transcriptional regulator [Cochlodiniinecator piscidefendens]|uniref:GntR family transcriptional regulator n=1 Tax=Cochlodiniinecator piscidefendens TaxID=2715756 RepID=UPI00140BE0B7|nr:GntR family transcriptional regulator [Cochlodiniinecator piscidefendens]